MDINIETLKHMYLEEKKSCLEIGKIVGLTRGAVNWRLKRSGVRMRTIAQGLKTRYPKGRFGSDSPRWTGGRIKFRGANRDYIQLFVPDHPFATNHGYVMEHRIVMEKKLGRYLTPGEIVHHISGDGTDNRPENLEVVSRSSHVHNHFAKGKHVMQLEERIRHLEAEIERLKSPA